MAVNIIMEKSTYMGRDSSGKEHYRAAMLADTTDELPTREWNGIVLEQGSSITSIGEGAEYMMNSAGAWVRQGGEGGSSLPDVTADDNGDVLTVVEGEWNKATPAKELPAVTSSDNNKVLTVVGGQWAKAAPSGGTSLKIVKASKANNTITFVNETQKSIYDSVNNGQFVVIDVAIIGVGTFRCYVSAISSTVVTFINVYRNGEGRTEYYEFTVSKSSNSDHTTIINASSDDYSSGEPS